MSKIVKSTDLTKIEGDPGHRANVDLPLENVDFQAQVTPWLRFGMRTQTSARSGLTLAITVVLLTFAGCICASVAAAVGAPIWTAIMMMIMPSVLYLSLKAQRRRKAQEVPASIVGELGDSDGDGG